MFGMLIDGSLQIDSLAFNGCFSCRNVFKNVVNALSKKLFKKPGFLSKKLKILYISDYKILFKLHQHVIQTSTK